MVHLSFAWFMRNGKLATQSGVEWRKPLINWRRIPQE